MVYSYPNSSKTFSYIGGESNTVDIVVGVVVAAAVIVAITVVIVLMIACRGQMKGK